MEQESGGVTGTFSSYIFYVYPPSLFPHGVMMLLFITPLICITFPAFKKKAPYFKINSLHFPHFTA